MKGLASASFFRAFDLFIRPSSYADLDKGWTKDGVDWRRIRHSYRGRDYGYSTDVFHGSKSGRRGWSIAIVRETWWVGASDRPVRTTQWAHMISGARSDALAWFKAQEAIPEVLRVGARERREL